MTTVEWLIENCHIVPKNELNKKDLIKQAKEMEKQQERNYSEEEVLEFGKYLLELSNSAMSKRTNIKMLDLEVGEKLVKDLFEQFKKK